MDEVIIEKQEYLLFDKYKLNTNRNITRYEYISNVPLKVSKREPDMRVCKCGAHLITLAYIFDNNIFRSRTLLGRKCPCCGHNYFTLKTIALCEEAFTIVEYTDLEENIGKEVQVDMYEVKRGDIYFADLTGIEHHCGSEQTGWRPVMIVQNDVGNYYSTTTIIATITSKIKGSQPTHVYLESGILDKDSIVCLEQLKTIDKQRLGRFICNVGDSIMERVNGATKDYIINYQDMQGLGMTGNLALPTLIAISSAALSKPPISSLAVLGEISIGGTLIKVEDLASTLQVCLDSGAKKVLLPITSAADLGTVPSDLVGAFSLIFYSSPEEAVYKALGVE